LHPGESEALSLALELHADLVLVDERKAYREAIARNLNAIGTIRVLERAAAEGLLDLADAFDRVKQTDFWISPQFLDERLKLHGKI
jgi:predicted nucleic acid-binding protein